MSIEVSISINSLSIEPSNGTLPPKATQMYKQAEKTFEEFGNYYCELDTLSNYYDFLEVADDDLLTQFSIVYNAEPWEENEAGYTDICVDTIQSYLGSDGAREGPLTAFIVYPLRFL